MHLPVRGPRWCSWAGLLPRSSRPRCFWGLELPALPRACLQGVLCPSISLLNLQVERCLRVGRGPEKSGASAEPAHPSRAPGPASPAPHVHAASKGPSRACQEPAQWPLLAAHPSMAPVAQHTGRSPANFSPGGGGCLAGIWKPAVTNNLASKVTPAQGLNSQKWRH